MLRVLTVTSLPERTVRGDKNILGLTEINGGSLRKARVELYLIGCRHDGALVEQPLDLLVVKVRDADRLDLAFTKRVAVSWEWGK